MAGTAAFDPKKRTSISGNRAAFAHALIDGRQVTEFEPGGQAAPEPRKLFWQTTTAL